MDELRLVVYPLIAGAGKALFSTAAQRRDRELTKIEQMPGGRLGLIYKTEEVYLPLDEHISLRLYVNQ